MQRAYWLLTFGVVALGLAVALTFYPIPREKLTPEQVAEKHGLVLVRSDSEYYFCDRERTVWDLRELIIHTRTKESWKGTVIVTPVKSKFGTLIDTPQFWVGMEASTNRAILFGDPEIIKRILPDLE